MKGEEIDWFTKVRDAIEKFMKEFQKYPYVYVYEGDIQAMLYYLISRGVNNSDWLTETLISCGDDPKRTTPVHNQVAVNIGNTKDHVNGSKHLKLKNHFDIGIWDTEHSDFQSKDYREKPVLIGIEIKYHWSKKFMRISENHGTIHKYLADLDKLLRIKNMNKKFVGYALWFLPKMDNISFPEQIVGYVKGKIGNSKKIFSYIVLKKHILKFPCDQSS